MQNAAGSLHDNPRLCFSRSVCTRYTYARYTYVRMYRWQMSGVIFPAVYAGRMFSTERLEQRLCESSRTSVNFPRENRLVRHASSPELEWIYFGLSTGSVCLNASVNERALRERELVLQFSSLTLDVWGLDTLQRSNR